MRSTSAAAPVLGFLVLLLAVVPASGQSGDSLAAIEATNGSFEAAVGRGDGTGLAALYTTDGQLLPPQGDIVAGEAAIAAFWQALLDTGVAALELTSLEVEVENDTAYEVGTYELKGQEGEVLDRGKYVVIWKRSNGTWKLHRDIWNTSVTPPVP